MPTIRTVSCGVLSEGGGLNSVIVTVSGLRQDQTQIVIDALHAPVRDALVALGVVLGPTERLDGPAGKAN